MKVQTPTHRFKQPDTGSLTGAPIQSLLSFARSAGISSITAWRFRKRGWLKTVNIAGRQYVTAEGIADFMARAARGEFAQKHSVPNTGQSSSRS